MGVVIARQIADFVLFTEFASARPAVRRRRPRPENSGSSLRATRRSSARGCFRLRYRCRSARRLLEASAGQEVSEHSRRHRPCDCGCASGISVTRSQPSIASASTAAKIAADDEVDRDGSGPELFRISATACSASRGRAQISDGAGANRSVVAVYPRQDCDGKQRDDERRQECVPVAHSGGGRHGGGSLKGRWRKPQTSRRCRIARARTADLAVAAARQLGEFERHVIGLARQHVLLNGAVRRHCCKTVQPDDRSLQCPRLRHAA